MLVDFREGWTAIVEMHRAIRPQFRQSDGFGIAGQELLGHLAELSRVQVAAVRKEKSSGARVVDLASSRKRRS
jgi:hypothetical protein